VSGTTPEPPGAASAGRSAQTTRYLVWLAATAGLALVVVVCLQAIRNDETAGLTALALVGAGLLVVPLVYQRLESLKVSATAVELTLSKAIVELGAPKAAELLERSGLTGMVESYEFVRRELRDPAYENARIRLQDALVDEAASLSRTQKLDPIEVRRIFRDGSPLLRVLTLGLMEGDPSLADASVIVSAISTSRTANEQFHGLKLAGLLWRNLSAGERAAVLAAADADPRVAQDLDRQSIVDTLRATP
jgi:hypothetical protein